MELDIYIKKRGKGGEGKRERREMIFLDGGANREQRAEREREVEEGEERHVGTSPKVTCIVHDNMITSCWKPKILPCSGESPVNYVAIG